MRRQGLFSHCWSLIVLISTDHLIPSQSLGDLLGQSIGTHQGGLQDLQYHLQPNSILPQVVSQE